MWAEREITPEAEWMQKNNRQWAASDQDSEEETNYGSHEEYVQEETED